MGQDAFDGQDAKAFDERKEQVAGVAGRMRDLERVLRSMRERLGPSHGGRAAARSGSRKNVTTAGRAAVSFSGGPLPKGDDIRQLLPREVGLLSDAFNKRYRVHRKGWSFSQSWRLHGVEQAGRSVLREAWRHAIAVGLEKECGVAGLLD